MTDTPVEQEGTDEDVFALAGTGQPPVAEASWIALPPAGLLSVAGADALLRWRPANVIAVVGERNSGKTTLVTEIYERLLRGAFAGHLFAHSLSLLGFEQRSFQARARSGAARPDTPRTSARDGLLFFHLALADERDLRRSDLLMSERAGESYRNVRDRPAAALELSEVTRARTVVLILDGQRVVQDRLRAEAFASTRNALRAFADSGAIRRDAEVQLVTTKCDLLSSESAADALKALTEFEQRLAATHARRFEAVTSFRTAARDPEGVIEPAWGIAPLLRSWLAPPRVALQVVAPLPELSDEFDRLLVRRTV